MSQLDICDFMEKQGFWAEMPIESACNFHNYVTVTLNKLHHIII